MGVAALSAGALKWLGPVELGGEFANRVATAVQTNAVQQGANIALNRQHGFSWSALAASAVGGAVDYGLNSVDPAALQTGTAKHRR